MKRETCSRRRRVEVEEASLEQIDQHAAVADRFDRELIAERRG